jgi:hypothetical protein
MARIHIVHPAVIPGLTRNPHHDKPEVAPFPPPDKPDFTVPASRQTETQRFTTKKQNNYRVNMDFVA